MRTDRRIPVVAARGFTMIEVLVSIVIITLGLLGLAGLQGRMQQAEFESYQRTQALVLLYDMVGRISANRATAPCFAFTTGTGEPYLGSGSSTLSACGYSTSQNNAMADSSLTEWDNLLKGVAEKKAGTTNAGAMIDARGCVSYNAATELTDSSGATVGGTGIYTVVVAWQGMSDTFAPTVNCGNNLYGAETKRRVVSTTFRFGSLK